MVRGEILPSAWVLQPVIMEGKEITRVIFLVQVTQYCFLSRGMPWGISLQLNRIQESSCHAIWPE